MPLYMCSFGSSAARAPWAGPVAGCGCAPHRKCAGLETLKRGLGGGAQAAVEGEPFSVKGLVRAVDAAATVELVIAGDVPVGIHAVYPVAVLLPARPRIGMSTFARWRTSTVQSRRPSVNATDVDAVLVIPDSEDPTAVQVAKVDPQTRSPSQGV